MKILLASSSSGSRGGGELYLLYLGEALAQKGHEMILWSSTHPRMDELCQSFSKFGKVLRADYRNTYDHPLRCLGPCLNFGGANAIAHQWQQCAPDLIHINKQNLEDGLDLLLAAARLSIPSLCTIHLTQNARYLRAQFAPLRDFAARRILRKFAGPYVTVLENRRSNLARFLGRETNLYTILNGVPVYDLAELAGLRIAKRNELALLETTPLVVAVGRMVPQKRPILFLEIAQQVLARIKEAKFLWVGDGWLSSDWDRFVSEHNLSGSVFRVPWQQEVRPFLAAADLFLHVADYEGLPLALLEAMSAGLPCAVTSNLLKEMAFLDSTNSIAVEPSGEWIGNLSNPSTLTRIGQAGRDLLIRDFSYSKMAGEYERLYGSLL